MNRHKYAAIMTARVRQTGGGGGEGGLNQEGRAGCRGQQTPSLYH